MLRATRCSAPLARARVFLRASDSAAAGRCPQAARVSTVVSANDLKKGNHIRYGDRLYQVQSASHIKPGKGGAFVQTELRAVPEGTKSSHRFRSTEDVEVAKIDGARRYTTLYSDSDKVYLMHDETYDQLELPKDMFSDAIPFVTDGQVVMIDTFEGQPLRVNLPEVVDATIDRIEEVQASGLRAGGSKARARLTNGVVVDCPAHVKAGDAIRVNVAERRYVSRASG